jgi:Leucine-rich repeat (LRR) protein
VVHRERRLAWALVVMAGVLVGCGGTEVAGPAAPTNVTATPGPGSVTLAWAHDGVGVTGFVIDRAVTGAGAGAAGLAAERLALVAATDGDGRSYEDRTAVPGVNYRYAVAAVGQGGRPSAATPHAGSPVQAEPLGCADPTEEPIEDPVLAAGIRDALGLAAGPTCADLEELDFLHLSWPDGDPVTSLAGLEHATFLRDLGLDGNDVTSLEPLAGSTRLRYLWLGGNPISDITPIAGLTNLRGLALWGTEITSFEALRDMTMLEMLFVGDLGISDVSPIATKPSLRVLHIQGAGLTSIDWATGLPALVELDVSYNPIGDAAIPVLAALSGLEVLGINDTGITDVSFLNGYTNLAGLSACCLELDDTSPITALTGLSWLDIDGLGIEDLSFLSLSPNLSFLSAWGNEIVDISALADLAPFFVNLRRNAITDIGPLANNTALRAGTFIDVAENCLDLTPGSAARQGIEALLGRGAFVLYEPQREGC